MASMNCQSTPYNGCNFKFHVSIFLTVQLSFLNVKCKFLKFVILHPLTTVICVQFMYTIEILDIKFFWNIPFKTYIC